MTDELKPLCDICGQPYFRHPEIVGMGRVCPVSAVTYRPQRTNPAIAEIVADLLERLREASKVKAVAGVHKDDDHATVGRVADQFIPEIRKLRALIAEAADHIECKYKDPRR